MTLNDLSYKQLTGAALILSLGVAIPTLSYLSRQQTQSFTSASTKSREQEVSLSQITKFNPTEPITITDIPFWYGKVGDEVLVTGNQFGESEGKIFVGKTQVLPTYWDNNNIQFVLNENMKSGDLIITRAIDDKSVKWFGILDIYTNATKQIVDINENIIRFTNFTPGSTIYITTDRNIISSTQASKISENQNGHKQYTYTLDTPSFIVAFANLNLENLHNIYVINNGEVTPFKLSLKTIQEQVGDVSKLNNPQ